jgi:hypothetical protein
VVRPWYLLEGNPHEKSPPLPGSVVSALWLPDGGRIDRDSLWLKKDDSEKFMNLSRSLPFVSCLLLLSCSKGQKEESSAVKSEVSGTVGNAAPRQKTWEEIMELMKRVKDGDHDAAYSLFRYYTFVEGNPTAAYFWAIQAEKLKHPLVGDDVIRSAEFAVWSALPANDSESTVMDIEDSDALDAEPPPEGLDR